MAFPGDHKVVHHSHGTQEQCDSVVIGDREIIIMIADDPEDMEIRVGDGMTLGGARFPTKAYVDIVAGNSGVAPGTDALAAAGVDAVQRSWPATSFGLKAPIDSPVLTGTPTAPTPGGGDDSLRIATTAWVRDLVDALVSQATTNSETVFPVGHEVFADNNGNLADRNGLPAATLRLDNANVRIYTLGGAGTALAGTWRARGMVVIPTGTNHVLMQRVA